MKWLSERVETADGGMGEVVATPQERGQLAQVRYDDGRYSEWRWASRFRPEGEEQ